MKKLTFVIITSSIIFFTNCKHKDSLVINENTTHFSTFPNKDSITFKNLVELRQVAPSSLQVIDSVLIMFNYNKKNNFFFNNYSLKSHSFSKGYLPYGKGPGEAIGGMSWGINGDILWMHDITLNKVFTTEKNKILTDFDNISFNVYPLKEKYYWITLMDNFNFYGVGMDNSKFKIKEDNLISSTKKNEFGTFENAPKNIPFDAFKHAYTFFIYKKPLGKKVVLSYRFTDAIEIYDIENNTSKAIQGPKNFKVEFRPLAIGKNRYVMERTEKTRFAFVNRAITDEYIYLLYSGKLNLSINPNFGEMIYVYDWDGNPVKEIILDREILCFTVSKNNKTIYAYDPNSGYVVESNIN